MTPAVVASEPVGTSLVASAPIPFKPASQQDSAALGVGWVAAVLLLALAAAVAVLLRRRLGLSPRLKRGEQTVTLVETTRLGERMRLSVVRYRDRELLIAHGDQSAALLAEQPCQPPQGEVR